jgi:hypothetical protein
MTEGFRPQVGEFQTMPSLPDPTKTPGTPWTDAGHINFLENEVNNQKVPSSERKFWSESECSEQVDIDSLSAICAKPG